MKKKVIRRKRETGKRLASLLKLETFQYIYAVLWTFLQRNAVKVLLETEK